MNANGEEVAIGWVHPGYLFRYPHIIASREHRRRLQHIEVVAHGIIEATLSAASIAGGAKRPRILPSSEGERGWMRVMASPEERFPNFGAILRAIGEISLTQSDYSDVQNGRSGGNVATQTLLAVAAESGFRDPTRLLEVCPVVDQTSVDYLGTAPAARREPDPFQITLEEIYGLLPDIGAAVQRPFSSVDTDCPA